MTASKMSNVISVKTGCH